MARNKFEENCKEKLEERTLQPSDNAWAKLSNDLDSSDSKNKRSSIFYMGIAASIVGVLLVTTVLFKSTENQLGSPKLVETERRVKSIQNKKDDDVNTAGVQMGVVDDIQEHNKEDKATGVKTKANQLSIENESGIASRSNNTNTILSNTQAATSTHDKRINANEANTDVTLLSAAGETYKKPLSTTLTFEDEKAMEVVNQVKKIKIKNGTVSDTEIEDLLKQAQKDILRAQLYDETTRTVDANALLQNVEDDLEESFRKKVFDGLKSGFRTIKTAVAEHNN